MAEQPGPQRPHHRPLEQLRTEAPAQKEQGDKYVSAFVSGDSQVDMSFRNPVLPKSSDHYKVGIDELTVNLGNLSMLEYGVDDVMFRVLRRGNNIAGEFDEDFTMVDGPDPGAGGGGAADLALQAASLNKWRDAFAFNIDRAYLTMHEVLGRCTEIAVAVGTYIRVEGLVQPGAANIWTIPLDAGAGDLEHFRISITPNGQLKFSGNRIFWANFTIEVPKLKYRDIIFKDIAQQYISVHPATGKSLRRTSTYKPKLSSTLLSLHAYSRSPIG